MNNILKKIVGVILTFTLMLGSASIAAAENGLLAPEGLTVSAGSRTGETKVSMKWDAVEGAQGYEIYYRMSNGDKSFDFEDFGDWILLGNTAENNYYATFNKEKKDIQLRVRAYNGTEFSKFSEVRGVDLSYGTVYSLYIAISSSKEELYVGKKTTLWVKLATDPSTWGSSDESIATVDEKGVVTAKKAGHCTITAISNDKEYLCDLYVKEYTKENAYRDELNKYISKDNTFALQDIDQDGAKELLITHYPTAASIDTKYYIYTFKKKKLSGFTVAGYGLLEYYKDSKSLKNSLIGYGSLSKDGKGVGRVEYYSIVNNKLVIKQKAEVKGKATKIKWYPINFENIDKYIIDKLK